MEDSEDKTWTNIRCFLHLVWFLCTKGLGVYYVQSFLFSGCVKRKKKECCLSRMVIKPLGKNVGGCLLQICDFTSLDNGGHFYEWLKVLVISTKMHFSKFCDIFKEGWYKKWRENLKSDEDKENPTNSRVFLVIKLLTQPWAFESEWNNYMNKCIKFHSLSPNSVLTIICSQFIWSTLMAHWNMLLDGEVSNDAVF